MKLITRFNLKEQLRDGFKFYKGHIDSCMAIQVERDWIKEYEFCNGNYRIMWINLEERAIFTFTEGDLRLEIYPSKIAFYHALKMLAQFYKKD